MVKLYHDFKDRDPETLFDSGGCRTRSKTYLCLSSSSISHSPLKLLSWELLFICQAVSHLSMTTIP